MAVALSNDNIWIKADNIVVKSGLIGDAKNVKAQPFKLHLHGGQISVVIANKEDLLHLSILGQN